MKVAVGIALALAMAPAALAQQAVPDLTLKDIDGKEYPLKELSKDKIIVIYSFAPACPSGKPVIPSFTKIVNKFKDKKEIVFIGVNSYQHGSEEELKSYVEENEIKYPVVHDGDKKIARAFGAKKVNSTYVIAGGKIIWYGGVSRNGKDDTCNAIEAGISGSKPPASTRRFVG